MMSGIDKTLAELAEDITTVAGLEALPEGSVVLDSLDWEPWIRTADDVHAFAYGGSMWTAAAMVVRAESYRAIYIPDALDVRTMAAPPCQWVNEPGGLAGSQAGWEALADAARRAATLQGVASMAAAAMRRGVNPETVIEALDELDALSVEGLRRAGVEPFDLNPLKADIWRELRWRARQVHADAVLRGWGRR